MFIKYSSFKFWCIRNSSHPHLSCSRVEPQKSKINYCKYRIFSNNSCI